MARHYCRSGHCKVEVRGALESYILSYMASAVVLSVPLSNALGANVKNLSEIAFTDKVSLTSIVILIVWLISGYVSANEKHQNPLLCIVHACGIPGVLLAVFAFTNP